MGAKAIGWHFKEKMQQQSKKDEAKWKLLVSKVLEAKNALGPFSSRRDKGKEQEERGKGLGRIDRVA
ncbi:unnamed protein product [Ilex paraguariensis]|uniref:Uncharacterized protein n=1 Tax=Ilex paraguariensis TaxID=185542 RepID=A0ABC8R3K7_9AQUA